MTRRRVIVPQRRRVFLGCEGESERSYGAWLRMQLEAQRRDVHLDVVLLKPGGGDPLSLVERAERRFRNSRRLGEPPYVHRSILLDHDRSELPTDRAARLKRMCADLEVQLIWARPCHEAFLLRHLPECQELRPATFQLAIAELRRHWPDYEKALPALQLARKLGFAEIRRASGVEAELAEFLRRIGFKV